MSDEWSKESKGPDGKFKKGHPPHPDSEKNGHRGGKFGYLGKPETAFTDEEIDEFCIGVVEYIQQKGNIWLKGYFADQCILWNTVEKLRARSPKLREAIETAKQIQERKLISEPYYKKADANHARFILARHHKGDWEDKQPSLDLNPGTANITIVQYTDKTDEPEPKSD